MRKIAVLTAAVALLLGSTSGWTSDKGPQGKNCAGGPGEMHGQGGPGGNAAIPALTAEQKAKLKSIGEAQKSEAGPIHEKAKTLFKELRALVASKAKEEVISAKLAEIRQVKAENQALVQKYREQREQVLTPTQRAQMALKAGDRMNGQGGEKMGMKGKKGMKCGKAGDGEKDGDSDGETKE